MNKYKPETEFRIASDRGPSGSSLIFNLKQDGYDGSFPNMVNDVTIQIHGYSISPEQYHEIEEIIINALNEKYYTSSVNSIEEFYKIYNKNRSKFPQQRDGQFIFNLMNDLKPDLANRYRGTSIDPFYNDDNIVPFLEKCFP